MDDEVIPRDHPHYYRIKAAALAWELAQERISKSLAQAQATMREELIACDLDPNKQYRLDPKS